MSGAAQIVGGLAVLALLVFALFSAFSGHTCRWYEAWDSDAGQCLNRCWSLLGESRKHCLDALETEARWALDDIRELRQHP